ncbi:integrin beta-1-like [Clavelina lepadiformis]|uniref:Integrin beta n=1 Tax=Clavelina lepadiformis TaxID=159417 RepID=A0ABP0GL29_CLALP
MVSKLIILLILVTSLLYSHSQENVGVSEICINAQRDCRTCIMAHPDCTWCSDNQTTTGTHRRRCRTTSENQIACLSLSIQNPSNEVTLTEDNDFSVISQIDINVANLSVTQLKPQSIDLKLRPGRIEKVNITFRRVIDYPLDLYYVMDLSNSMSDDLETLQQLGSSLVEDIRNVTQNVRLGFGSFVDKVLMPFASTIPEHLQDPCYEIQGTTCAPVFGFRHQLSITSNGDAFRDAVEKTNISGNVDSPEGGFDALMQIAVCQDIIQWRQAALRVILFTSDASPHLAMDGKLAAILESNDMNCHLESGIHPYLQDAMLYAKSRVMDYPSVGQLKHVFNENKIQTIFAITQDVYDLYKNLPDVIENSFVDRLNSDSSNIVSVIETSYNALRTKIQLTRPTLPENINLKYRVSCRGDSWIEDSLECNNVSIAEEAVFQFEFIANSCPNDVNQRDMLRITSNSITDTVDIGIEYICDCECTAVQIPNSRFCNNSGILQCGNCDCNEGYRGTQCQCSENGEDISEERCLATPLDEGGSICSDQGICECGVCECRDGFYGEFCQCRNTGCPAGNAGQLCGGPDRGRCENCNENQECICVGDWTPNENGLCACNEKFCRQPSENITSMICSGNGRCACDACECDSNSFYYSGVYCERCIHPQCKDIDGTCEEDKIRECAACIHDEQSGTNNNQDCQILCQNNSLTFTSAVPTLPAQCNVDCALQPDVCRECLRFDREIHTPITCSSSLTISGCTVHYLIAWLTEEQDFALYIRSYNEQNDCPQPPDPLTIALPVVAGIVLLGIIALIVWKILQTLRDRIEYKRFMQDLKSAATNEGVNPLYSKASIRVENPAFVG